MAKAGCPISKLFNTKITLETDVAGLRCHSRRESVRSPGQEQAGVSLRRHRQPAPQASHEQSQNRRFAAASRTFTRKSRFSGMFVRRKQ